MRRVGDKKKQLLQEIGAAKMWLPLLLLLLLLLQMQIILKTKQLVNPRRCSNARKFERATAAASGLTPIHPLAVYWHSNQHIPAGRVHQSP